MTKLYELTDQFREISELEDVPQDAIEDTLEAVEMEIHDKMANIVLMVKNLQASNAMIKNEVDNFNARIKSNKSKIEWLSNYLKFNMHKLDYKKFERGAHLVSLTKGRDVVLIENADKLPDYFVSIHTEIKPDKKSILTALKNGDEVPGARIETNDDSLKIK